MPKCIKCYKMLPPQFMDDLIIEVALDEPPKQCVFCRDNITEISLTTANGSIEKYTKVDAEKEYHMFLNMLKERVEQAKELGGKVGFEPKMKG